MVRSRSTQHAARSWFLEVAGEGESEIRQIAGPEDFAAELTPELREQDERWRARLRENPPRP